MAATPLTYTNPKNPQPANQLDSSPPILPRKRPSSESYYSSYGESEGTPSPKRRCLYSRPGFNSDPSSPTFHSTPWEAQVPQHSCMEDSEEESDDVYDEFDLGDFTKEEIKRYESMVGPGDRLRDAAPPEEPSGPAPEPTADTRQNDLGASIIDKFPNDLHGMLRAGLSNAAYRLIKDDCMPSRGMDTFIDSEEEYDSIADKLWGELARPAPELKSFIRHNQLRKAICDHDNELGWREFLDCNYGPRVSIQFAQRVFEQEVYDFGRSRGLSKEQALGHVIKARKGISKRNIDLPELGDYESSDCEKILKYLHGVTSLETFIHCGLQKGVANMEAVDQTNEEKAARKESRKALRAERRVQKGARRQAKKKKSQKSTDSQAVMMSKEPNPLASNPERPAQVQPIEDWDKPLKQKKKARKLKSELQLPIQSEAPSEQHDKHKRGRVGKDVISKKAKRKRVVGPQHSPFFQRSSDPKAKKHAVKKAEQLLGFQSPMIQ